MYQRGTTDWARAPEKTAAALAAVTTAAAPAATVIDALAEALLALPGTLEVHVRRWSDARRDGFAVTYWPRSPVRCRSHVAASWDSEALRRAVGERRPVTSTDPAELPAGVVGRLAAGTPVTVLALGADAEPWGVAAVAHRGSGLVSGTAVEAMATLGTMAGLGLRRWGDGAGGSSLTAASRAHAGDADWPQLCEHVRRAEDCGASLAVLLVRVDAVGEGGLPAAARSRRVEAVFDELRALAGEPGRVSHRGDDLFGVLLPNADRHAAHREARRVAERLTVAQEPAGQRASRAVLVAVAALTEGESAETFFSRALALARPAQRDIRGAVNGLAGAPPNLPH